MKFDKVQLFQTLFLVIIFFICLKSFYSIFLQESPFVKNSPFIKEYLKDSSNTFPIFLSVIEAKQLIPEDGLINFSPEGFNIYRITTRYLLYPLKLSQYWNYFIDFEGTMLHIPLEWRIHKLSTGVRIIIKPDHALLQAKPTKTPYPALRIAIIFFIVTTINLCIGSLAFRILQNHQLIKSKGSLQSVGYFFGLFIVTIILWLFVLWGGTLERNALIILWVMASLALLLMSNDVKANN